MKHFLRFRVCYCPKRIQPIYLIFITTLLLTVGGKGAFAQRSLSGTVVDTTGSAITGATVTIKGTSAKTLTDNNGRFSLRAPEPTGTLVISHLGHQSIIEKFDTATGGEFHFTLVPTDNLLEEVEVSTGYQTIPKERATGSFVHIDNELLNRSVGSNILERLRGVTRGMDFHDIYRGGTTMYNQSGISIRGRSTINSNAEPLIILDNFPFQGDINSINPEDIESVTVLQDAAAASIWGAYAGNGVIVLTSKKGRFNQPVKISINADTRTSEQPDLYYTPAMPISDYIEVERYLFGMNAFNGRINTRYNYITPTVEALLAHRNGDLSDTELEDALDRLKQQDVRADMQRYIYRPSGLRKAALNLSGGSGSNGYYLGAGYDRNSGHVAGNHTERVSFNARNTLSLFRDKVTAEAGIQFSGQSGTSNSTPGYRTLYDRFADEHGRALSLGGGSEFRQSYIDTAGGGLLRDWNYRPLDEMGLNGMTSALTGYQLQASLAYRPWRWVSLKLNYQYASGNTEYRNYNDPESFTVRNDWNRFAQVDATNGTVSSALPDGGRFAQSSDRYDANYLRFQADFNHGWADHRIDAIAGAEVNGRNTLYRVWETWHGYDPATETYVPVSYSARHRHHHLPTTGVLPGTPNGYRETTVDRNRMFFGNASYTYGNRYTLSASARKDASNIFGVATNMRGTPLWSAGVLWRVSKEPFFQSDWLTDLAIRITMGYNGNVNKRSSAYITASVFQAQNYYHGGPYQVINNPPNAALRWERVRMQNAALDFGLFANRISGSVEYYRRRAIDLISRAPFRPSSGVTSLEGNWSSLEGHGWDVTLSATPLKGTASWNVDLMMSHTQDRVTDYALKPAAVSSYFSNLGSNPIVGRPLYNVVSYAWGGLDSEGAPQGYANGELGTDYTGIYNGTPLDGLVYHGRATPAVFGGGRNNLAMGPMEISVNVTYKLGYYFRRTGLSYSRLYSLTDASTAAFNADYANRWQKPGDEMHTHVPAAVYPAVGLSNSFYLLSEALVERGDHVRLQDVRLAYALHSIGGKRMRLERLQVSVYANNIGILWRANGLGIDPDTVPGTNLMYPSPRTYAIGLNINF